MQNITLTVSKHNYEKRELTTNATGFAVSANYKYDGHDTEHKAAFAFRKPVADVLDTALMHILNGFAISYDTAAVKIVLPPGYTATQMQAVVDKYTPEEQFTSITFE